MNLQNIIVGMDKLDAKGSPKDRRRVEGLSSVNEYFAPSCDVFLVFIDFQYVATISKKAQRTHEEGEKKEGRRKHKTATSVLTVVEFKVERGYASSMLRFSLEQETLFNDQGQENWSEGGNLFGGDWDYCRAKKIPCRKSHRGRGGSLFFPMRD